MLKDCRVQATLPVSDLDRARAFYAEKLNLTPTMVLPAGLYYECGDHTGFGLAPTPISAAGHTQMVFQTPDLLAEIGELRSRGVVLEDYPELNTVNGIADLGWVKAAWFKDSEGNVVGILERVKAAD